MTTVSEMIQAFDSALAGTELVDKPRALLLANMCEFYSLLDNERLPAYWSQLQPLVKNVPSDMRQAVDEIGTMMQDEDASSKKESKGFAVEVIKDVNSACGLLATDEEGARKLLEYCEDRLRSRRWPGGKDRVRLALAAAWKGIDRHKALGLTEDMHKGTRAGFVRSMNREQALNPDEWKFLVERSGMKDAIQIARAAFENDESLNIPDDVLLGIGASIRGSMPLVTLDEDKVIELFKQYVVLVARGRDDARPETTLTLVSEMYNLLAGTNGLESVWPTRFSLMYDIVLSGVTVGVLTDESFEQLLERTPKHLKTFARTCYLSAAAARKGPQNAHAELLEKTDGDPDAELMFIVYLAREGELDAALSLCAGSARSAELSTCARRAVLCNVPESAGTMVTPQDMADDPVGTFLALDSVAARVDLLKQLTYDGAAPPKDLWVDDLGTLGLLTASAYTTNKKRKAQFAEFVTLRSYQKYGYEDFEKPLLEALISWGDSEPKVVRSLLEKMWEEIQPSDTMLQSEWMRESVFKRCCNAFASDPGMLTGTFTRWIQMELVDKGRTWNMPGNKTMTLKYKPESVMRYCLVAAAMVDDFSPLRRDFIIQYGLERYKADADTVETAAKVYSSDKDSFQLMPPFKLKPEQVEPWQLGAVKSAYKKVLVAALSE